MVLESTLRLLDRSDARRRARRIRLPALYRTKSGADYRAITSGNREHFYRQSSKEFVRVVDLQDRLRQMRGQKARVRRRCDAGLGQDFSLRELRHNVS